jgi:uncharacterized phiE125 gp8 family phage protein
MSEKWLRVTAPDADTDPLTLAFVRDQHLRVTNGTLEDAWIRRAIRSSLAAAQKVTNRLLLPQTWDLRMSRPTCHELEFNKAPVREVGPITYVDSNGDTQTFGGSPAPWELLSTSLQTNQKDSIVLDYAEVWPTTQSVPYPVTIRLALGYPLNEEDPAVADIPEDILSGRLLYIGELYKQRSESVQAINNAPSVIRARDLWLRHRVY